MNTAKINTYLNSNDELRQSMYSMTWGQKITIFNQILNDEI